jgi:hypothetical protein
MAPSVAMSVQTPASQRRSILRLVELFGLLPSLDDGGPEV